MGRGWSMPRSLINSPLLLLHVVLSHGKIILESFQCPIPILKKSLHCMNLGSVWKIRSDGRGIFHRSLHRESF
jgi:hypothetical protein